MRLAIFLFTCTLLAQPPVSNPKANKRITDWVDPVHEDLPPTHYKLFHSALIHADYSYLVYLPPDYETAPDRRYPSIYWLHGGGGRQRGGTAFVKLLDAAIRNGSAPPAIVFLLNGLGESCWADSKDGKLPVESIIVTEMVPGFDRTYRTIPRREARAIEGMSMGGYGALRLGFVHNDVFGVVTGLAPGLISEKDEPVKIPPAAFEKVMGSDPAYFHDHTAWAAAEQNAAKIRVATRIRILVGDADTWIYGRCQVYHDLLNKLTVPHDLVVIPGAHHNYQELYAGLGVKAFDFYTKAFAGLK